MDEIIRSEVTRRVGTSSVVVDLCWFMPADPDDDPDAPGALEAPGVEVDPGVGLPDGFELPGMVDRAPATLATVPVTST